MRDGAASDAARGLATRCAASRARLRPRVRTVGALRRTHRRPWRRRSRSSDRRRRQHRRASRRPRGRSSSTAVPAAQRRRRRRRAARARLGRGPCRGGRSTRIGTRTRRARTTVLGAAGATIVAHDKTRQRLRGRLVRAVPRIATSRRCRAAAAADEDVLHDRRDRRRRASPSSSAISLEAHTDGDAYVRFPGLERRRRG